MTYHALPFGEISLFPFHSSLFFEQVKRNIERFPDTFRFQLTQEEYDSLRSQWVTPSPDDSLRCQIGTLEKEERGQHRKYLPYAFTEQGVSMLSAVLRSDTAIKVSIQIINAFVEMRRFIQGSASLFAKSISKQLALDMLKKLEEGK